MVDSSPSVSTNNKVATRLAYVITAFWALSFLVDIIVKTYDPPASVHALMMIVAGAVFGEGLIKTRNGPASSNKETKDE
jgi:hypothetical protein